VLPAPEGIAAGAVDVKRQILRLDNAQLDLLVVESQLQFLQFLVACIAGVLLGAHVRGFRGAVIGLLAGYVVAAIRNSYLGAVAGMIAGGWYGWLCSGEPGLGILGTLVGIFLGSCLGDWRKLRAPPGSG